ncbi:hypothetical protein, partial [Comamonas aquatica]|uniref:hypothetical protein n=1 Tax=Comamonas aquatica TaxID=225991 RepID=UPI0034D39EAE
TTTYVENAVDLIRFHLFHSVTTSKQQHFFKKNPSTPPYSLGKTTARPVGFAGTGYRELEMGRGAAEAQINARRDETA